MKIAFFEIKDWERDYLAARLPGHDLVFNGERLAPELAPPIAGCAAISPFIYSPVTAAIMAAMPALKLVATRSTGFDHVDLAAAAARGIAVCSAGGGLDLAEKSAAVEIEEPEGVGNSRCVLGQE